MENHGSLKAYTIGFIFSIILTVIPLMLVLNHVFSKNILLASILG
ncbi:cytochrome o ubiquinol oxidase subunit IV, partial [Priestia megaterium]